ncbi:MAG TPA: polymer-forming cytoskeletal protein [Gemmatimonadaceae bacterium]|nr:polymer-forming cytoskeletal protein [Gemmatimonadaceae bacterium]
MRALIAFIALAFGSFRASAQARPADSVKAAPAKPAPAAAKAAPAQAKDTSALSTKIAERRAAGDNHLPDADRFTLGDRSVAANTTVDGPIAVARGNLDVYGTVNGDVVALDGDIHVHRGALVTGDAWAAGGSVVIDGGVIQGQKRVLAVSRPALPVARTHEPLGTWGSIKLVIGWFAILTIIGMGVMVFAEANLDGVVIALERGFARSFWIGLTGQVVMLPGLLVLVVALAITVLGVLLIPFAIVAYVIAAAGLVTLGFLAVARLTGGGLTSDRGTTSPRGVHLRALIMGLIGYLGLWMIAALFTWNPVIAATMRALAVAITWVAATVGLGAALTSRAGTQRPGVGSGPGGHTDEFAWQTPTPVTGVAAATRRQVSSSR